MKNRSKQRTPLSRAAVGLLVVSVVVLCMVIPSLGGPRNPRMRVGSAGTHSSGTGSVESLPAKAASPGVEKAAVLATNSVWLAPGARVISGDVVVNDASPGPTLDVLQGNELLVDFFAKTPAGSALQADSIKVRVTADVDGNVFCNDLDDGTGTLTCQPLPLPVFDSLPPFEEGDVRSGVDDVEVDVEGPMVLPEGDYGDIIVEDYGTLTFTGGVYNVYKHDPAAIENFLLTVFLAFNQDFHFGPGTATVYTRSAPNSTSFHAEPCTSPLLVVARAGSTAHSR